MVAKLKEQQKLDQQKIAYLEDRIKHLEETNSELRNDKDFLVAQIKGAPKESPSTSTSGKVNIPTVVGAMDYMFRGKGESKICFQEQSVNIDRLYQCLHCKCLNIPEMTT